VFEKICSGELFSFGKRRWHRKLHNNNNNNNNNGQLNNLYSYYSLNIVWVIKLKKMQWQGYVACMREIKKKNDILVGRHECQEPVSGPK
jgi:hypothetical protein